MTRKRFAIVATLPLALMLVGCMPGEPGATSSPGPSSPLKPSASPSSEPPAADIPLPDDATMLVTATATASNGATLDLRLVVHRSVPWNSGAEAGTAATVAWCEGEVDAEVISTLGYSFTQVDYSATAADGSWPSGETIWLHPTATYTTLAASGDVSPVAYPDSALPHCARPAVLPGAGAGSTFLGAEGDASGRDGLPALQFWSRLTYGFNNDFTLGAPVVSFSDCAVQITTLGTSMGAPGGGWHEDFLPGSCIVGGSTGY